jgi:hypothetical protein
MLVNEVASYQKLHIDLLGSDHLSDHCTIRSVTTDDSRDWSVIGSGRFSRLTGLRVLFTAEEPALHLRLNFGHRW